ncbi:MAG: head-tail connector protein, partial [Oscillospiraceae bacterium]|nr:head-tail connector protein [Oscillospiraceae bacterium]
MTLLEKVKANLILQHDQDDALLQGFIAAAVNYAESFQHLPAETYSCSDMPPTTEQAVIMLASHF